MYLSLIIFITKVVCNHLNESANSSLSIGLFQNNISSSIHEPSSIDSLSFTYNLSLVESISSYFGLSSTVSISSDHDSNFFSTESTSFDSDLSLTHHSTSTINYSNNTKTSFNVNYKILPPSLSTSMKSLVVHQSLPNLYPLD